MKSALNRWSFMKIAGMSLGIGVLYSALPVAGTGEAGDLMRWLGKENGEALTPFFFVQLSDAHVGFNGPPRSASHQVFKTMPLGCCRDSGNHTFADCSAQEGRLIIIYYKLSCR